MQSVTQYFNSVTSWFYWDVYFKIVCRVSLNTAVDMLNSAGNGLWSQLETFSDEEFKELYKMYAKPGTDDWPIWNMYRIRRSIRYDLGVGFDPATTQAILP